MSAVNKVNLQGIIMGLLKPGGRVSVPQRKQDLRSRAKEQCEGS